MTIYPITPKAYVAVGRERWTDRAKKYFAWKEDVQKLRAEIPDSGASITFHIPMPKSWSKKKKAQMMGQAHTQRPDLSNLIKAFEDACRYGEERGDQTIWHYAGLKKVWSDVGMIQVEYANVGTSANTAN